MIPKSLDQVKNIGEMNKIYRGGGNLDYNIH